MTFADPPLKGIITLIGRLGEVGLGGVDGLLQDQELEGKLRTIPSVPDRGPICYL